MLDLNSMGISDIQNTITLIKTQVTTYKATLTSYKVAYNNATSKLADARQMVNDAKSQIQTLPDQLPLPKSLFGKSTFLEAALEREHKDAADRERNYLEKNKNNKE